MKRSEAVKTIVIYCTQNILLVLKSFQILHNMTVKVLHITRQSPALKLLQVNVFKYDNKWFKIVKMKNAQFKQYF